jgi:hypothetical protein
MDALLGSKAGAIPRRPLRMTAHLIHLLGMVCKEAAEVAKVCIGQSQAGKRLLREKDGRRQMFRRWPTPSPACPSSSQRMGPRGVEAGGGTSLATPIFTAIWAIANQNAGSSLGRAAPAVAALTPGEIVDLVPLTSETNVSGALIDSSGPTAYSAKKLLTGRLYGATDFISAV